jgi:hypothetical protein
MVVLSFIVQYLLVVIKRFKNYLYDEVAKKQASLPKIIEKFEVKCQKEINVVEKEINTLNTVINALVENVGDL